jgi:hypothetical protein
LAFGAFGGTNDDLMTHVQTRFHNAVNKTKFKGEPAKLFKKWADICKEEIPLIQDRIDNSETGFLMYGDRLLE